MREAIRERIAAEPMARALLFALLAFAAAAQASPPVDWLATPNAVAEYVEDPVFGGRVALYRAGPRSAETVVLVHGLGKMAARDWSTLVPALAERYQVLAIDLPGFGYSDKGNHHYSPDNFARVLDAAVRRHAPRPFALIGHSMGGAVALEIGRAHV